MLRHLPPLVEGFLPKVEHAQIKAFLRGNASVPKPNRVFGLRFWSNSNQRLSTKFAFYSQASYFLFFFGKVLAFKELLL